MKRNQRLLDHQPETQEPSLVDAMETEDFAPFPSPVLPVLCLSFTGQNSLHLRFPNLLLQRSRELRVISRAL